MPSAALFLLSVVAYAGIPMLLASRRTPFQFLLLYTHIASVLTLGGLLGAVYVLPIAGDVSLLAGQVSYGAFMFTTLVTVIVGRDLQVVRNIVVLTIGVNVLVYCIFLLSHVALSEGEVPNPFGTAPEVFDQSLRVVLLGGMLIILELLALLAVLEIAKRRLGRLPMAPVYVLAYVAILCLDGVLFPALVLRPGALGDFIASAVLAKLVLAAAYAVPLIVFVAFYARAMERFEATPIDLRQLVSLRRDPMLERIDEQEMELRARAEQAASATATVSQIIDAATSTLLVATDSDFVVTHFNRGAQELLGYSASEVIGRSVEGAFDPEEVVRHADALGVAPELGSLVPALVRHGTPRDWTLTTRSGERRTMSLSFTQIRDDQRLVGYLCAGEDVSTRLRTEAAQAEALRRELESVARLEEADRMKDEVVSTISHELRTPIAAIRGYGEILSDGDLGELAPEQADAVAKMLRNTARLSSLVDDLLHLDRVRSADVSLRREPTDMVAVVEEARDGLSQLTRGRELNLEVRVPDDPVVVVGDALALERVVLNLGGNAIKFTPDDGSVTLTVAETAGACVLTVADTGIGISEEDQPRIRGRFYRSSEAYRLAVPGSGLGLSVVDAIVAAHGGTIDIASAPGQGTTVTVVLPAYDEEGPTG